MERSYSALGEGVPEGILNFMKLIGKLKKTKRAGWVRAGVERPESVADHSFRCAVFAMVLSDLMGLNVERAVKIALLHDVQEALIGDYDRLAKEGIGTKAVEKAEREAIERVLSYLPNGLRDEYLKLLVEFIERRTEEAVLCKQIDKMEMILQALEYEEDGCSEERLQEFWSNVESELGHPYLKIMFKVLRNEKDKLQVVKST